MVQFTNISWLMLGLDLLAKITLLLLLAIVVDAILKRHSAAARHCLWAACFVGLLILPLAFYVAPGFQLNIWPAAWSQPTETQSIASNQLVLKDKAVQNSASALQPQSTALPSSSSSVESTATEQSHPSKLGQVQPTAVADISASSRSHAFPPSFWFAGFWIAGLAFSLLPLIVGIVKNHKLRLISSTSMDPLLVDRFEQSVHRLQVTRSVELRVLDQQTVPMTWGIFRPVILLPRVAEQWSAERLESVLLHELAHVQRLDVLWQVLARVTCSVYFFHPLVWYANRRLRTEREVACDDCVLINGVKSSIYAEQLLHLARENCSSTISYAAVAMAQRSGLERRVRAVLNRSTSRLPVSRGVAAFTLTAFTAIALLLAIPKLGCVAISQDGKSAATQQSGKTENTEANSKQDQKAVIDPTELIGLVVDEQGSPLADVLVDAWSWFPGNETKTDKEGRFRLKFDDARTKVELRVMKDGYSPFYKVQQSAGVRDFKVTLNQRTYIEGVVTDSDGKPVPNIDVRGEQGMQQGDGVMIGFVATTTKTDDQGRYRLYVHPDTYQLLVRTSSGQVARLTDIVVRKYEAKRQDIDLEQGVRFEANVINSLTDKPFTDLVLWHFMHKDVIGKTDSNGKLVIEGMLPGRFEFHIGEGEAQQFGPFTGYMPRTLGRWWSPDAKHPHQREESKPDQFQRNLDDLTFDLEQDMESVTIYVEPGVTFSGRVTDPDGNPVESATVAPAKTGSGNSLTGDTRYSVKTDKEGRYSVVMPAGKDFQYNLIVHDGDYQQWRKWANGVIAPLETQPGETHQIDLKLTRPAIVRGKVVAEGGRQVAGREVRAHAKDLLENRYYDPSVRTKEDGSFELKFVRPGEHWIQVEPFYLSAGQAPAGSIIVTLEEGQVLEDVELTLPVAAKP
jgi:beta-lactamase regulating signal transducer with metallopeptidase domain